MDIGNSSDDSSTENLVELFQSKCQDLPAMDISNSSGMHKSSRDSIVEMYQSYGQDVPSKDIGNSSGMHASSRDSIVETYPRNFQDVSPSEKDDIMSLGYPSKEYIIEKDGFVISYNPKYKVANVVCELLTREQMKSCYMSRKSAEPFFEDESIDPAVRATADDYKDSKLKFDQAHLAGAANHAYNSKAYLSTFCYSNIVPMYPIVNSILSRIEKEARSLAEQKEKVYIYTGPVFYPEKLPVYIKEGSKLRVPDSIFKVIVHIEKNLTKKFIRVYKVENSENTKDCKDIRDWKKELININSTTGLKLLEDVDPCEIVDVLHRMPRRSGAS